MNNVTFDNLPDAVNEINDKLSRIEKILFEKRKEAKSEADEWFNLIEFCNYHPDKPSKPTVYGWVNSGTVPVHKGGKKLRFLKSEIDSWLKQGKKRTLLEIIENTDNYLKIKGGRNA
jgi:excisionase family DNA binding protein